jgi:hypothetical protein
MMTNNIIPVNNTPGVKDAVFMTHLSADMPGTGCKKKKFSGINHNGSLKIRSGKSDSKIEESVP